MDVVSKAATEKETAVVVAQKSHCVTTPGEKRTIRVSITFKIGYGWRGTKSRGTYNVDFYFCFFSVNPILTRVPIFLQTFLAGILVVAIVI